MGGFVWLCTHSCPFVKGRTGFGNEQDKQYIYTIMSYVQVELFISKYHKQSGSSCYMI